MSATITWVIEAMNSYPTAEGQSNVVFSVHWRCNGSQDNYSASIYGTAGVTYEAGSPYTPYNQLTQAKVLQWVWDNGVDKAVTESAIQTQIDNFINPPVVTLPLPWVQS
jgi:hypothetical protein